MRLSVIKGDPGYRAWRGANHFGAVARVMLDGQEVPSVHTADSSQGYVLVSMRDEAGNLMLNRARDRVLMKQLRGKVEIEMVRDPVHRLKDWKD